MNIRRILLASTLALGLVHGTSPARAEGDFGWSPPGEVSVVRWGDRTPSRSVEEATHVRLDPGELAVVAVDPGDRFRIRGGHVDGVGFGSGGGSLPDAILWRNDKRETIDVPTVAAPEFLVVRGEGDVTIEHAAEALEPMRWHRFDLDYAAHVLHGASMPTPPSHAAGGIVRRLLALEALGTNEPALLMTEWLESALRRRPLVSPFFSVPGVTLTGGVEKELPWAPRGTPWREVTKTLEIQSEGDVAEVILSPNRKTPVTLRLFEGAFLLRELHFEPPRDYAQAAPWMPPETFRLLLRGGRARVEVIEGSAALSVVSHRARTELFDGKKLRLLDYWRHSSVSTPIASAYRAIFETKTRDEVVVATEALLASIKGQPGPILAPVARALLERRLAVGATLPFTLAIGPGGHSEDRFIIDMAARASSGAATLEDALGSLPFMSAHPELREFGRVARALFASGSRWGRIPLPPGVRVRVEARPVLTPDLPDGRCTSVGAAGERWTKLERETVDVELTPKPGYRSRVVFRPIPGERTEEGEIDVDGVPVFVHGTTGIGSVALLSSGRHRISPRTFSSPLLFRAGALDPHPCKDVVELARWGRIASPTDVSWGDHEPRTLVRVTAHPDGKPTVLQLSGAFGTMEAWFLEGATGSVVLPVDAETHSLRISPSVPTEIRLWRRVNRDASPPSPPEPRPNAAEASGLPNTEGLLLETIRSATREIATGTYEARERAREQRAYALRALGFPSLAALDRPLIPLPSELDEETDLVPSSPLGTKVEPSGILARLAPLEKGLPDAELKTMRERIDERAFGEVVDANRGRHLEGAAALLVAFAAERSHELELAGTLLERIGLKDPRGVPLSHAATLMVRRSSETRDRALSQHALAIAALADRRGDPGGAARALLTPVLRWETPSQVLGGSGYRDVFRTPESPAPLYLRVREAWLDAPSDVPLFHTGERYEAKVRVGKTSAVFEGGCAFTERIESICRLRFEVDGVGAACKSGGPRSSCELELEPGEHRLTIAPPERPSSLAWGRIRIGDKTVVTNVVTPMNELVEGSSVHLDFLGPTVLEISAAQRGAANGRLEAKLRDATHEWTEDVPLAPSGIEAGLRVEGQSELPFRIPVLAEGRVTLTLTSIGGTSLARIRMADVKAAPPSESIPEPEATPKPSDAERPPLAPLEVRDDPESLPLSIGAVTSGQASLSSTPNNEDVDAPASWVSLPYVETSAHLHRAFGSRAWLELAGLARLREGPASYGAFAKFDRLPGAWFPGLYLGALGVVQPMQGFVGRGGHLLAEGYRVIGLGPLFNLTALVGASGYLTDERERFALAPDVDVYSTYPSNVPWSTLASARLDWRPLVDTMGRVRVDVRSTDRVEIDRADLRAEIDTLPGRGLFPWLGATLLSSARVKTSHRKTGFVRHIAALRATAWTWAATGHRVSLFGTARLFFDAPSSSATTVGFTAMLGISYDFTGTRGLQDYPRRTIPFRERMEEGGGRVRRSADLGLEEEAP